MHEFPGSGPRTNDNLSSHTRKPTGALVSLRALLHFQAGCTDGDDTLLRCGERLGSCPCTIAKRQHDGLDPGVQEDIRRLALVMGVAALDTYMHALVYQNAYETTPMPKSLAQLDVRFDQLVQLADSAVDARRRGVDARPRVAAKNALQRRLLRETFQKFDDVSGALAMAGNGGSWQMIAAHLTPPSTAAAIRSRLNAIVHRRNQIVHEGDLQRQSRPRHPRLNDITATEAAADLDYLHTLVNAIDRVVA